MFLHDRRNSSSRQLVEILKTQLASKISISNDYESDFPGYFHTTGTTHPPDDWWKKCSKVSSRLEFSNEITMKLKFQNVFTRQTQLILQTSDKNSQKTALYLFRAARRVVGFLWRISTWHWQCRSCRLCSRLWCSLMSLRWGLNPLHSAPGVWTCVSACVGRGGL